jgi:RES domain-containing protein
LLTGAALHAALNAVATRPFRDVFFRATLLQYGMDPLGKRRPTPVSAGRFNVAGGARVLYLADSHQTCAAEVQAVGGASFALAMIPVHVQLQAVLDLREPATLAALQLTDAELTLNFRLRSTSTPTQELGEACASLGIIDAIAYRSLALPSGTCLAVIESNLRPGVSGLTVSDARSNLSGTLP